MRIARFGLATLAFIVFAAAVMVVGINIGENGDLDWNTFWNSFEVFGGVIPFLTLLGVLIGFAGAFFAILWFAKANHNIAAASLGIGLVIAALIANALGFRIDLSFFGGIWSILIFIVLAILATAVIVAIAVPVSFWRRKADTTTTETTTTS